MGKVLKYQKITDDDFDLQDVGDGFNSQDILPETYQDTADEKIPQSKINSQQKLTISQLQKVILERGA